MSRGAHGQEEGTPLPEVVVQQKTHSHSATKTKKHQTRPVAIQATATSPQSARQQSFSGQPPAATEVAGIGSKGLAIPLTTTRLSGEAIQSQLPGTSDTAQLLTKAPGISIFSSGGLSGLPAINGLNDDRVKILLNGMVVTSACTNHMNPPLSYIDPSQVAIADVIAGVTPVSNGGDSLGGTVVVESMPPHFANIGDGVRTSGSLSAFYRSNGDGVSTAAHAEAATQNVSLGYSGAWTKANDYARGDDGPIVRSTLYEAQNHALTFAAKNGGDLFTFQGVYAEIPYQGYVNQRMDMVQNEAWLFNARYLTHFDWGTLDVRAFYHTTEHRMDMLADKSGRMPMDVDGTDLGYSIKTEIPLTTADVLRMGNEFHRETLNDWWPPVAGMAPMMGPDTFIDINHGTRERLGTFVEWEHQWAPAWSTLIGFRNDMVWMDTGDVKGYSAMYAADAAAFNARGHQRTDANFDVTALARYEPTANETYEIGYARKTRSPNLYERYAWSTGDMAADMIGWYGDANGYVGNLDLKPEVANTVSFTTGWHDRQRRLWDVKVTPYYTYVEDYIDADYLKTQGGMSMGGMGMVMPSSEFVTLRFANHDAQLYGVNVSGSVELWDSHEFGLFGLSALVGYVNGENLDSGDTLYHMMPLNAQLTLNHQLGNWSNAVQLTLVNAKTEINDLRNEPTTPGYALVDLRSSYQWENVRFDFGISNLLDKLYYPPLGGVDWADYNADGRVGLISPVPGQGRSFNAGVTVAF
ncbi:TonB-dependent receptor [Hyphomicrobium denitrificans]|uniref:TonB-dependent receptor n=1 Tax=Hyphomicrobium denitrificans TaxID=53399 RepID=UPI001FCC6545|nr:TonB-dependent receptor plug domain-containing protein [Hyphomicrobium denitrificans]